MSVAKKPRPRQKPARESPPVESPSAVGETAAPVVSPKTERRPTLFPIATTQNAEETIGLSNDRLRRLIRDLDIRHLPHGQLLIVVVDDVIAAIRQHGVGGAGPSRTTRRPRQAWTRWTPCSRRSDTGRTTDLGAALDELMASDINQYPASRRYRMGATLRDVRENQLLVRLSDEEDRAAGELAEHYGLSKGYLVRMLIKKAHREVFPPPTSAPIAPPSRPRAKKRP
jgi:hypothetical protein